MSRDESKTTNIPWWIGVSQKVKPCGYAMTGVLIGAVCIRYTTAAPVGAALSNGSES